MSVSGRDLVEKSHARLAVTLAALTDDDARRPSLLPDWSVGHVLTHLARNADSLVRMLDGAVGEIAAQYPGGHEQRAGDIEAGAGRPAAELVDDVMTAATHLDAVMAATPDAVWRDGHGRVASGIWALAELPFRRRREVEIHHVDLGLAYRPADWPDDYVDEELGRALAGVAARLPPGTAVDLRATDLRPTGLRPTDLRPTDRGRRWVIPEGSPAPAVVEKDRRHLLAWLVGRGDGPAIGPWKG